MDRSWATELGLHKELKERAVLLVRELAKGNEPTWPAIVSVAGQARMLFGVARALGVESICKARQFAPSAYYVRKRRSLAPELRCPLQRTEETLQAAIHWVWEALFRSTAPVRYGASFGGRGTTKASDEDLRPLDLVRRIFHADRPDQLWVADFSYETTWAGFVYVAFIIDMSSRMIVGWRTARWMSAVLTLDALEPALRSREVKGGLIDHSDRGSRYLAVRYGERLIEAGIRAGGRGEV